MTLALQAYAKLSFSEVSFPPLRKSAFGQARLRGRQKLGRQRGSPLPGTLRAWLHDEASGLMGPQLGVEPAAIEQFRVGALLDNAPAIHHHKPVHELQRGEAVGDGDDGLARA
jgi:hypothetical protein